MGLFGRGKVAQDQGERNSIEMSKSRHKKRPKVLLKRTVTGTSWSELL